MFRLITPASFFKAVSDSPRVKFTLAWATFGGVVIPSALLMSLGFSDKYILPAMLAVIPLFQYVVVCIFPTLNRVDRIQDNKTNVDAPPVFNYLALMCPTMEEKPGGYYVVQARKGVGKTSVYGEALLLLGAGASVPRQPETYHKAMVVLAEGQTDLDFIAFLTSTEAEKKTRDEAIKLQRKPLETPLDLSSMLLTKFPEHG